MSKKCLCYLGVNLLKFELITIGYEQQTHLLINNLTDNYTTNKNNDWLALLAP